MQQKSNENVVSRFFIRPLWNSLSVLLPYGQKSAAATIHLLARSNSVITELRLEGVEYRQNIIHSLKYTHTHIHLFPFPFFLHLISLLKNIFLTQSPLPQSALSSAPVALSPVISPSSHTCALPKFTAQHSTHTLCENAQQAPVFVPRAILSRYRSVPVFV